MKEYRILILKKAENDINNIIDYIAFELKNKNVAVNLNIKLKEIILSLSKMPQRYPLVQENYLHKQGYRKIIVENFIIFYLISEVNSTVNIIRILSNKINWIELL